MTIPMAQFVYYLPAVERDIPGAIRASGLLDRFTACRQAGGGRANGELGQHSRTTVSTGPDGRGGLLIARNAEGLRYDPDGQEWRGPFEAPATPAREERGESREGTYWIGVDRECRPGPAELARQRVMVGKDVELADGNLWHIPVWRYTPQVIVMTPDGVVGHKPLELRRRLGCHLQRLHEVFGGGTSAEIEYEEILGIAADMLRVNYRIGPDPAGEVSMLELITPTNFVEMMDVLADAEHLHELIGTDGPEKKTPCTPGP